MKFLRVKNWDKLQYPSEKPLPWIKFFTALLAPTKEPSYSDWPDQTKALLHHVWLMARVFNNRIPDDWLTKERLNLKSRLNLQPLLDAGFVWFEDENGQILDSLTRTRIARSGVSTSQSKESSSTGVEGVFDQALAFEGIWSDYPRPIGRKEAYRHFCATVTSDTDLADIRRALENYKSSGEVRRGFLKHGSTWFNNWRDYIDFKEPNGHTNSGTDRRGTGAKDSGSTVEIQPVTGQQAAD